MKPRDLHKEQAPEAQHEGLAWRKRRAPPSTDLPDCPGPRETPQCRLVAMRLVPELASGEKERHRQSVVLTPGFRISVEPLWRPGVQQLDPPLFQSAGAFSSSSGC